MSERLKPKERKALIMDAAIKTANKIGYAQMRREDIAKTAKVSEGLVSKYMGTMKQMRKMVMRHAITFEHHAVVAQGLVIKDPTAMKAPEEVRKAAIESLQ